MIRAFTFALLAACALLAGCASQKSLSPVASDAVLAPHYDGIYRLSYNANGSALYYRFYPDGNVVSARSDAPAAYIFGTLTLENASTSRGTWSVSNEELRVAVEEGTVWYDSKFEIRGNGRIALSGLPRSFEFIRTDDKGNVLATR